MLFQVFASNEKDLGFDPGGGVKYKDNMHVYGIYYFSTKYAAINGSNKRVSVMYPSDMFSCKGQYLVLLCNSVTCIPVYYTISTYHH